MAPTPRQICPTAAAASGAAFFFTGIHSCRLGFGVLVIRLRSKGLGLRAWDLGFGAQGFGVGGWGLAFGVGGSRSRLAIRAVSFRPVPPLCYVWHGIYAAHSVSSHDTNQRLTYHTKWNRSIGIRGVPSFGSIEKVETQSRPSCPPQSSDRDLER